MKSNELAKLAGVTVRTLRHYHAIGLLDEPPRQANGYRDYRPQDLLRVLRIRQLASLGFPLDQVAGMLDELDAERSQHTSQQAAAPQQTAAPQQAPTPNQALASQQPPAPQASADDILADLDAALQKQIAHLQHQRTLIAHLRTQNLAADFPERAAGALAAMQRLARVVDEPGFMGLALSDADQLAMGIAAHLYSDAELAEIERVFNAIVDRNYVDEYREISRAVNTLPANASAAQRQAAVDACVGFLAKLIDCFDSQNWLRADKDYEVLLDRTASESWLFGGFCGRDSGIGPAQRAKTTIWN